MTICMCWIITCSMVCIICSMGLKWCLAYILPILPYQDFEVNGIIMGFVTHTHKIRASSCLINSQFRANTTSLKNSHCIGIINPIKLPMLLGGAAMHDWVVDAKTVSQTSASQNLQGFQSRAPVCATCRMHCRIPSWEVTLLHKRYCGWPCAGKAVDKSLEVTTE